MKPKSIPPLEANKTATDLPATTGFTIQPIFELYHQLYAAHPNGNACYQHLLQTIQAAKALRSPALQAIDHAKAQKQGWFLNNQLVGMSLYVDRFCGNLKTLIEKIPYFKKLGVNVLHLMPLFESPENESDGGYAISNFRKINERFGSLADLEQLQKILGENDMYLMLDIVLNHTSNQHQWALHAKNGDGFYQEFFYMFEDRKIPDAYEKNMPEVFPEAAPGNFTYIPECNKWVMTVFHNYQWDLNFGNPAVFEAMVANILFYANLGVDILRIDAPAFIWKQIGTQCQNLPQAHTLLRLVKQCVLAVAPGMALLGEAIVGPKEIIPYFGTDEYTAKECDFAYNATQMALQWDALATEDTVILQAAKPILSQKPMGTSWINYTRCHDDIGLAYDDEMIQQAGYNPYEHRKFIKNYYSGNYFGSNSNGALFAINPKTQDARISGSLASLCGLEKSLENGTEADIELAIKKIILMQAYSFFIGGLPMIFYGDEVGYTNDYAYKKDDAKSYDNRWMHRPIIDWEKMKRINDPQTVENKVFFATKKLIDLRKNLPAIADNNTPLWLNPQNKHIAAFVRTHQGIPLFCLFNFSKYNTAISWHIFKENNTNPPKKLYDYWQEKLENVGADNQHFTIAPYGFCLLHAV